MRIVMLAALVGCIGPMPRPTEADVLRAASRRPQTTLVELERGRSLYVERCSGCHRPYEPDTFAAGSWPGRVGDMAKRANLGTESRKLIVLYLVTLAAR